MAIEFMCACGQVLRSGEDRVGKKVRCPSCWAIQLVPQPAPQMMPLEDAFGVAEERPAPSSPLAERYQSSAVFMTGVHDAVPDSTDMMAAVRPRNSKPPAHPSPPSLMAPATRSMNSGMRPPPPVKKPSSSAMPAQMRLRSGDLGDTVEGPGDDTLVGSPEGEATATQAPASSANTAAVMMLLGGVLMFAAVLVYVLVGRS